MIHSNPVDKTSSESLAAACAAFAEVGDALRDHGIPFGAETSLKLVAGGRIYGQRLLVGAAVDRMRLDLLLDAAHRWGMPTAARELLEAHSSNANAILFGLEPGSAGDLRKVYLEFWDSVRDVVRRTGTRGPQLLHLGVKWIQGSSNYEVARYSVHPLLPLGGALRQIRACYRDDAAIASEAVSIVQACAQSGNATHFLFETVQEEGNVRQSFDINLYRASVRVADVAHYLLDKGAQFDIAGGLLRNALAAVEGRVLGHLSGGFDRAGREFLTVYAELAPMPVRSGPP